MKQFLRIASAAAVVLASTAAAPPVAHPQSGGPFPQATIVTQSNGVIVASQATPDTPLVDAQIFLPVGSAQQPADRAGIAAVTAATILQTPVDAGATTADTAQKLGASVTYTIDPLDTRFSIESKASDLPRLVGDIATAMKRPDASRLAAVRDDALDEAAKAIKDPALTAFAMIKQATFQGNGYARLDAGAPTALAALAPADVLAFAAQYRHGAGTAIALSGNVTPDALAAVSGAFADFPATQPPRPAAPTAPQRTREVVAHRDIATPWVAVGYTAPSQYGSDFAPMLVIESLLGRGGDVHAFTYGSDSSAPSDYVGGYYQYEAQPGLFIEFFNGANVDQDLRNLEDGVGRLRGGLLPQALLNKAKAAALGQFLTSVSTLDDQSWLLGRSALSPYGAGFENALVAHISSVTAADVQRVARKYLTNQAIAVVLPSGSG